MPAAEVMTLICNILFLISGVGLFMYGMHVMGAGLENSAGKSMQRMFARISSNRFAGVGVGAASTAIIQSSSATSVMVIGFVNAGLMTLGQAVTILMGANIGTTMTAFLVSFSGGTMKIIPFLFMLLTAVGVAMLMFSKKDKIKRIGDILTGVGLIFIGLEVMSRAIDDENINSALKAVFSNPTVQFPLLLIFFGVIATAALQSSSVVTAIVIALLNTKVIELQYALFIVLGSNIGTTVTAIMASSGAGINAKRAALFMFMFNVFGVVLFTPIVWPLQEQIANLLLTAMGGDTRFAIALFHLSFNMMTMLLLIGFVPQIVKMLNRIIKDKPMSDVPDKLYFLDKRLLRTPTVAVAQMTKEIMHMAHLAEHNFDISIHTLLEPDADFSEEIAKNEHELNYLNKAITNYLVKISSLHISDADEKLIGSYYHVVSDIERIGDHAENFNDIASQMEKDCLRFSEDASGELMDMYSRIKLLFKDTMYCFETRSDELFDKVAETEQGIDECQRVYEQHHVERLRADKCNVETGVYFNSCTTDLERVADHLTNIAYSVRPKQA